MTMMVLQQLAVAATVLASGPPGVTHPDPANLHELECAVSELALSFGAARFPADAAGVAAALHTAFHLEACSAASTAAAAVPRPKNSGPQLGGYHHGAAVGDTSGATLYVSPAGSDASGDGSEAKPFATLQKAQAAVRRTPVASRPATTVYLRAGTYYLGETLAFGPEDSGASAAAPVVWSAYPGENVTVSGGVPLATAAKPLSWSSGGAPLTATLPAGAPLNFTTLFVDNERAIWARYPNGNNKDITGMCFSKAQRPGEVAHAGDQGCPGYARATSTTVPRRSPKSRNFSAAQTIGRYGDYGNFDIMFGGDGQPEDPDDPSYSYADLFAAPGDMCVDGAVLAELSSAGEAAAGVGPSLPNCSKTKRCTVPCSTPHSRKWFAHFDRMQGQTDTFAYDKQNWTNKTWAHPELGVVRFLGDPDWGTHTYPLAKMDQTAGTIELGAGGWQFADIGAVKSGGTFYVEGILEEVDASWEWAVDPATRTLHFVPNGTTAAASATVAAAPKLVEAAILSRLIAFVGESAAKPVKHLHFRGVRFAHAATTQLERYEVPSGGDWAIARTGAVFVENAEGINVSANYFDSVGGNGVTLSKHARNCTVSHNRFAFPGDSPVVLLGVSNMADGTDSTYPAFNTGKQTSCYFQAVSGRNRILDNVCYNGPRAGFNFNDGFLGGSLVQGNLIANMVRETGDHGPFNSWDRTPYITTRDDGTTSIVPLRNHIYKNLIINGYNGVWSLDHDDGSSYYNDSSNFLVFGGCKNYKGDHKICGPDNVIVYPGINSRSSGARSCQTNDNGGNAFDEFIGNKCIQDDGEFYTFGNQNCTDKTQVPFTAANTFYSKGANFSCNGASLEAMQAAGLDIGTTVHDVPTIAEIIAMGKAALA